jgi:hypothetical protein
MLVLLGVLSTCGCLSQASDVASDPRLIGDLRVGEVYRLRVPVKVYSDGDVDRRAPSSARESCSDYWVITTADEAEPRDLERLATPSCARPKPHAKSRAILNAGSRLRFSRVTRYDYVTMSDVYYVFEMLDGRLQGKEVCGNALIKRGTLGQVDESLAVKG